MAIIKVRDNGISSGVNTPAFASEFNGSVTVAESTNALVPYSTEIFDTHNAYDNTAGNYSFTVPTGYGGKYAFQVHLECDDNVQTWDRYRLLISFDGGTTFKVLTDLDQSHTANITMGASIVANLSEGDEVSIHADLNVVASSANPEVVRGSFSGFKIIGA